MSNFVHHLSHAWAERSHCRRGLANCARCPDTSPSPGSLELELRATCLCCVQCLLMFWTCLQPKYIDAMVHKQVSTGCDVVTGTRYIAPGGVFGWDFKRKLTSRGANLLAQLLLQPRVSDLTGSFRLYKRQVFEEIISQVQSKVRPCSYFTLWIQLNICICCVHLGSQAAHVEPWFQHGRRSSVHKQSVLRDANTQLHA